MFNSTDKTLLVIDSDTRNILVVDDVIQKNRGNIGAGKPSGNRCEAKSREENRPSNCSRVI